jgi:hypothetical protein
MFRWLGSIVVDGELVRWLDGLIVWIICLDGLGGFNSWIVSCMVRWLDGYAVEWLCSSMIGFLVVWLSSWLVRLCPICSYYVC